MRSYEYIEIYCLEAKDFGNCTPGKTSELENLMDDFPATDANTVDRVPTDENQ